MKRKEILYGVVIAVLLLTVIFLVWNNYGKEGAQFSSSSVNKCGIENCHGLDITCGENVPDACDQMYAAGDRCRQFVTCKQLGNECVLEKSDEFNECKSCVESCEEQFPEDYSQFFQCESQC